MALNDGGFTRGRRLSGLAEGLGTALVVLLLVGAITYAASRPTLRTRLDLTESADYTLSAQTRAILAALDAPVRFTQLMRPEVQRIPNGLGQVQARAIRYVDNLLREYALASDGLVSVRRLDPHEDRIEAEQLARELHLTRYNVVVVQSGDRTRQVFLEDLVTIDRGLADPERLQAARLLEHRGETPLTSAVLFVSSEKPRTLGVLRGAGGPEPADTTDFGLWWFSEGVRGQGYETRSFDLAESDEVPADIDVVALWGPDAPIGERVAAALARHVARGGGLLVGVDPLHADEALDALLGDLGVRRERTILCRDDVPWDGPRRAVLAVGRFESTHPVSAPIARQGWFATFEGAGGLDRRPGAPPDLSVSSLALTSDVVFGDLPAGPRQPGDWALGLGEQRGARSLGCAVSGFGAGRAVVFGNSSLLTNLFLTSAEGGRANMDLGLNAVHWLAGREEAIEARPRQVYESRVDLTEEERGRIALYVMLFLPLAGAALGVGVWLVRRR